MHKPLLSLSRRVQVRLHQSWAYGISRVPRHHELLLSFNEKPLLRVPPDSRKICVIIGVYARLGTMICPLFGGMGYTNVRSPAQ